VGLVNGERLRGKKHRKKKEEVKRGIRKMYFAGGAPGTRLKCGAQNWG